MILNGIVGLENHEDIGYYVDYKFVFKDQEIKVTAINEYKDPTTANLFYDNCKEIIDKILEERKTFKEIPCGKYYVRIPYESMPKDLQTCDKRRVYKTLEAEYFDLGYTIEFTQRNLICINDLTDFKIREPDLDRVNELVNAIYTRLLQVLEYKTIENVPIEKLDFEITILIGAYGIWLPVSHFKFAYYKISQLLGTYTIKYDKKTFKPTLYKN